MFSRKIRMKNIGIALLAGIAAFSLLLMMTVSVFANTVHVYDNAGVLNASQVQSNAANLPYAIDIYTVNNFNGDKTAFQQQTASHIANSPSLIVLAIDTAHHFIDIKAGSQVRLSNSQAQTATNAFVNSYGSGGYTGATNAALGSLQSSLSNASGSSSNGGALPPAQPQGGGLFGGIGFSALCCIGLLVLAGAAAFAFIRRRSQPASGFGWFNQRRANIPPQEPYYNQPYNQGYPPNYGPGYPGYNQGGINPLAAGGLGAAAGGLVGYELGKEAGERDGNEQGNQGNDYGNNNGGDFGGGASGDFGGGGGGGDFGGGGGGGGDFGGGGSGSF